MTTDETLQKIIDEIDKRIGEIDQVSGKNHREKYYDELILGLATAKLIVQRQLVAQVTESY